MEKQKEFERQSPDKDLKVIDKRQVASVPITQDEKNPIVVALQMGSSPELIQKLMDLEERRMDLAERDKANLAKEAFVLAVAEFKENAPVVLTDKDNKHFGSRYASKGQIVNTIAPAMAKFGLTHRWEIKQPDNMVEVTCILTHKMGHSEKSVMQAPPDTSGGGSKNPIQQIKSTRTYLQVATFEDVTGTAAGADLDDDGNAAGKPADEFITEDQAKDITKRLKKIYGDDASMFLNWIGVDTVDTILAKDYKKAIGGIKTAEKAAQKPHREPGSNDK